MSFLVSFASILPGTKRGENWAKAMKAIAEANVATKIAKKAEKKAEDAFLALSADEQVEIVHAAWVVNATPEPVRAKKALLAALLPWANAVLLAVALGSTILVSVPLHAKMALAHNDETGRRLVLTNWPRTIAWTARLALCGVMLAQLS